MNPTSFYLSKIDIYKKNTWNQEILTLLAFGTLLNADRPVSFQVKVYSYNMVINIALYWWHFVVAFILLT